MLPASSKIWLMNVTLAAVIVLFGIMSLDIWTKQDEAIPEIRAAADSGTSPPEKRMIERVAPPEATYGIVAEKNLFSPDRAEPLTEGAKPGQPRLSEKMVFLYGVVTLGGQTKALVSDPASRPETAGERAKDKWVRVGDTIGNFSVAEIGKEKIVLKEGADRHEIFLYDESKPAGQTTGVQPAAAPTVVVTGGEPAAPLATPGAGPAAPEPASAPAAAVAPGAAAGTSEKSGEYTIVNTPFGPIKRRVE